MILFVSDVHFGRSTPAEERTLEADLIACLRSFDDRVEAMYLVGDVFDQYIEYRHLVPKGYVRFQGLLADWTDRGVPVTYLVGNHDLWHQGYFEQELGVRMVFDEWREPLYGKHVYLAHGDGLGASLRLYNLLKPIVRHPLPVWLYRTLLPGDLGYGLARWYNRTFGNDVLDGRRVEQLRHHARHVLAKQPADLVVMGHGHHAECIEWPEGIYLNPGCWYETRTLGLLDAAGARLGRWQNGTVVPLTVQLVDEEML